MPRVQTAPSCRGPQTGRRMALRIRGVYWLVTDHLVIALTDTASSSSGFCRDRNIEALSGQLPRLGQPVYEHLPHREREAKLLLLGHTTTRFVPLPSRPHGLFAFGESASVRGALGAPNADRAAPSYRRPMVVGSNMCGDSPVDIRLHLDVTHPLRIN